ncbi:MAG: hypothetical protein A3K04_12150 [Gallionellales bacterium RBG_16_56_9]|nr:MAG: hypothetical protein A3K04_12150 [Gallionellales bacterium RBG_16_56_9]
MRALTASLGAALHDVATMASAVFSSHALADTGASVTHLGTQRAALEMPGRIPAHEPGIQQADISAIAARGDALGHALHVQANAVGAAVFAQRGALETIANAFLKMLLQLWVRFMLRGRCHDKSPVR